MVGIVFCFLNKIVPKPNAQYASLWLKYGTFYNQGIQKLDHQPPPNHNFKQTKEPSIKNLYTLFGNQLKFSSCKPFLREGKVKKQ